MKDILYFPCFSITQLAAKPGFHPLAPGIQLRLADHAGFPISNSRSLPVPVTIAHEGLRAVISKDPAQPSRRAALLSAATTLLPLQSAAQSNEVDEKSFRHRIETVDALFRRAKAARTSQAITFSAYGAILGLLRAEETGISEEARAHQFKDITEGTYWQRGRFKFPSSLQMELKLLDDGKDPAVHP
jgi:hypothetical protein